jgi:hypothetical protein
MDINLNEKGFWKELNLDPSRDLNENIDKFYSKYSKEISYVIPSTAKDKSKVIGILKIKSINDKYFFLDIFLKHLERKIKEPQFSEINSNDLDLKKLKSYSLKLIRRLRDIDRTKKELYVKPVFYPSPFSKEPNKIWFIIKKYSNEAIKHAKRKSPYKGYIEKLIILSKRGDKWCNAVEGR